MLTSPITVTIDGVAHNLSRINNDNFGSVYLKKVTGLELKMNVRHSYEGKVGPNQFERHNIELIRTTWDVDGNPVVSNVFTTMRTLRGSDPSIVAKDAAGLNAFVTANKDALVAWES
jgi:hypothetical protein